MFDLITGTMERPLRERAPGSKVTSIVVHVVVLTLVVGIPLLRVTNTLPDMQTMMAFAVAPPAPPPPPPPPPPAPARSAEPRPIAPPVPKEPGQLTVRLETQTELTTEATTGTASTGAGVEGGVEGGVAGGVLGGVVGGIISSAPPPPPPPPAPVVPVRVGGQIKTPELAHRVEPDYPEIAKAAHLVGTVILEAVVGTDGCVESVKVLRSRHLLLDNAAIAALKQWRYTPLVLNGIPTPFVLTVTFTFSTR